MENDLTILNMDAANAFYTIRASYMANCFMVENLPQRSGMSVLLRHTYRYKISNAFMD